MSPTTDSPRKRPIVRGLKALAGARAELPATTTAVLADGPIEYVKAGDGAPAVAKGKRRYDAINHLAETAAEIEQAGPFPEVPLTVVSGGKTPPRLTTSPEQVRRHGARQLELVKLSALGTHAVAPASGHFPQITDPDIVVRAVGEVLAA